MEEEAVATGGMCVMGAGCEEEGEGGRGGGSVQQAMVDTHAHRRQTRQLYIQGSKVELACERLGIGNKVHTHTQGRGLACLRSHHIIHHQFIRKAGFRFSFFFPGQALLCTLHSLPPTTHTLKYLALPPTRFYRRKAGTHSWLDGLVCSSSSSSSKFVEGAKASLQLLGGVVFIVSHRARATQRDGALLWLEGIEGEA